jgi:preprotein translocase subunit YajC
VVDWAYAANGAPGGDNPLWTFVVPMVLMVAIFYFLLIRPQQRKAKEHKSMLESLQRGDRVITAGGLIGEITSLTEQTITIEVADKVRVEVGRPYVTGFAPKKSG